MLLDSVRAKNGIARAIDETEFSIDELSDMMDTSRTGLYRRLEAAWLVLAEAAAHAPAFALVVAHDALGAGTQEYQRLKVRTAPAGQPAEQRTASA